MAASGAVGSLSAYLVSKHFTYGREISKLVGVRADRFKLLEENRLLELYNNKEQIKELPEKL